MGVNTALWDDDVEADVLEALQAIYGELASPERDELIVAILAGPPVEGEAKAKLTEESIDYRIFLRLDALGSKARAQNSAAKAKHTAILNSQPTWADALTARPAVGANQFRSKPRVKAVESGVSPQKLVAEILTWEERGAEVFEALSDISLPVRLRAIEHACSSDGDEYAARVLLSLDEDHVPDDKSRASLLNTLDRILAARARPFHREIASLLKIISTQISRDLEDQFLSTWDALIPICLSSQEEIFVGDTDDHLSNAINSSAGLATHALLALLGRGDLERDAGIAEIFSERLELIIGSTDPGGFDCRVLAASRLYILSWVDFPWARDVLMPRLSWKEPREAAGAWQGYMWNPRIDARLFSAIKADFVETFSHLEELALVKRSLTGLLISVALDAPGNMSQEDTIKCLREMGSPSRRHAAWILAKRLEATEGAKRPELWQGRIGPWIRQHWPTEADYADGEMSDRLAWAATLSDTAFPVAVKQILPIVSSTSGHSIALRKLEQSDLCARFPSQCLQLLDKLLPEDADLHRASLLEQILMAIQSAQPELNQAPAFARLHELLQSPDARF